MPYSFATKSDFVSVLFCYVAHIGLKFKSFGIQVSCPILLSVDVTVLNLPDRRILCLLRLIVFVILYFICMSV